jgi:hypothetical protein
MQREIKFRGKRVDNGEFVFGDPIHGVGWKKGKMYILPLVENLAYLPGCHHLDGYEVIPETVGQLLAKVKRENDDVDEIFEDDLIVHGERILQVAFINGNTTLVNKDKTTGILLSFNDGKVKAGNIHDNHNILTN